MTSINNHHYPNHHSYPRETPRSRILTHREFEIAGLVAQGFVNKQIADILGISRHTVNSYTRRIFSKLGVNNRAHMVAVLMSRRLGHS